MAMHHTADLKAAKTKIKARTQSKEDAELHGRIELMRSEDDYDNEKL